MQVASELSVGLKEWAVVCGALERGRQIVLLRKGGIHESGGEFELEHPQFILFPTYLHQDAKMLKPSEREGFAGPSAEPAQIHVSSAGALSDIVRLKSRAQVDAIDDEHIWSAPLIDMRFNYRPENPLYLLVVRVWRLADAVTIPNTPAYAGCKSWVPLERAIDVAGALPVLGDAAYEARRRAILERL